MTGTTRAEAHEQVSSFHPSSPKGDAFITARTTMTEPLLNSSTIPLHKGEVQRISPCSTNLNKEWRKMAKRNCSKEIIVELVNTAQREYGHVGRTCQGRVQCG